MDILLKNLVSDCLCPENGNKVKSKANGLINLYGTGNAKIGTVNC